MYSHLIACTGWSWEYIDDYMTIPRLEALTSYWVHSPPTHIMLAAFFEVGKKKDDKNKADVQPFGDIFKELPL